MAKSLAQAAYRPPSRPLALYADGEPVGLLLLWDSRRDSAEPADELYVWRLMVDARHQGRGHGRSAVRWVIDEARRLGVARVGLAHNPANEVGAFYQKLGFAYTGVLKDGEREMIFPLA
ncbi:MAG: GNAT family N-acetyltransferase [Pseudomonadota bacterium]